MSEIIKNDDYREMNKMIRALFSRLFEDNAWIDGDFDIKSFQMENYYGHIFFFEFGGDKYVLKFDEGEAVRTEVLAGHFLRSVVCPAFHAAVGWIKDIFFEKYKFWAIITPRADAETLEKRLPFLSPEEFIAIYTQVIFAMEAASSVHFQHNDLHSGNVLVRTHPPRKITYGGRVVQTTISPLIIDYGISSFVYEGVFYGDCTPYKFSITTEPYYPPRDLYYLINDVNTISKKTNLSETCNKILAFFQLHDENFKNNTNLPTLMDLYNYIVEMNFFINKC